MKKFLVAALAAVFISVSSTAIAAAGGEANGEDTYVNQTKQQKTRLFSKKDKNSENAVKNLKNNEKRFSDKKKGGKQQNGRGGQYGRPPMNDQNGRGGQYGRPPMNDQNGRGGQYGRPPINDQNGRGGQYGRPPMNDQNGRGGQYGRPPMNDQNGRGGQQKEPAFNNGNEQKAQPSAKDKDGNLSPVSGSRNPQGNQSAKTESEE